MILTRTDSGWAWSKAIAADLELSLRAERLRRGSRGDIEARVFVEVNGVVVSYDDIKIDKQSERTHLANDAKNKMGDKTEELPKEIRNGEIIRSLDTFCLELWPAEQGELEGTWVAGTAEPVPVAFALHPFVVEGGGTIIFAHPGRGKSFITGLMAVTIDAGTDVRADRRLWAVRHQRVLFINLERGALSVSNRLGNINAALGLPRTRPLMMMNQRGRSLSELVEAARRTIRKHQVELVILDSISRAGAGDLTENQPVNRIIDMLNGLAPTWLAIAHAPRASDEHLYGSVHFDAGADVVVRLISEQEEGGPLGVGLKVVKENDIGKQPLQTLALEFDGPRGLCGVRQADKGEFPEIEKGKPTSMRQVVIDYLLAIGHGNAKTIHDATGYSRQNISALLSSDPAFVKLDSPGRAQEYGVLGLP